MLLHSLILFPVEDKKLSHHSLTGRAQHHINNWSNTAYDVRPLQLTL